LVVVVAVLLAYRARVVVVVAMPWQVLHRSEFPVKVILAE
jgi:hypothetical protein